MRVKDHRKLLKVGHTLVVFMFGPNRTFEAPCFHSLAPSKRTLMPRAAFPFVYTLCRAQPNFTADHRAITEIARQFKVSKRTIGRV